MRRDNRGGCSLGAGDARDRHLSNFVFFSDTPRGVSLLKR